MSQTISSGFSFIKVVDVITDYNDILADGNYFASIWLQLNYSNNDNVNITGV
jgi:hypothetical protein